MIRKRSEVKEILQRALDVALWGRFPCEMAVIFEDLCEKDLYDIMNEALRQRAILEKQVQKLDTVINILRMTIFGDSYTHKNTVANYDEKDIAARKEIFDEFKKQLIIAVDTCKFDPESGEDFTTTVMFNLAQKMNVEDDPLFNHMDGIDSENIIKALDALWFKRNRCHANFPDSDNKIANYYSVSCVLPFHKENKEDEFKISEQENPGSVVEYTICKSRASEPIQSLGTTLLALDKSSEDYSEQFHFAMIANLFYQIYNDKLKFIKEKLSKPSFLSKAELSFFSYYTFFINRIRDTLVNNASLGENNKIYGDKKRPTEYKLDVLDVEWPNFIDHRFYIESTAPDGITVREIERGEPYKDQYSVGGHIYDEVVSKRNVQITIDIANLPNEYACSCKLCQDMMMYPPLNHIIDILDKLVALDAMHVSKVDRKGLFFLNISTAAMATLKNRKKSNPCPFYYRFDTKQIVFKFTINYGCETKINLFIDDECDIIYNNYGITIAARNCSASSNESSDGISCCFFDINIIADLEFIFRSV